jgi:hypothetical protein
MTQRTRKRARGKSIEMRYDQRIIGLSAERRFRPSRNCICHGPIGIVAQKANKLRRACRRCPMREPHPEHDFRNQWVGSGSVGICFRPARAIGGGNRSLASGNARSLGWGCLGDSRTGKKQR